MPNPFRHILSLFRHGQGMVGPPPSAREVSIDPGLHAIDFSRRYSGPLDYHASRTMLDLGIPPDKIGDSDPRHGIRHAAFNPHHRDGGSVAPDGRIVIDSGVMNPELLTGRYGEEAGRVWAKARLGRRMQAIVTHELIEYETGSHDEAVTVAPTTRLPIDEGAREILRAMARGCKGR